MAAVCVSAQKGTKKEQAQCATLIANYGISGDAHAGSRLRQISLLPKERIDEFNAHGAKDPPGALFKVAFGDFGENIVTSGIDFQTLTIGSRLRINDAVLELTQFGKECHSRCAIYYSAGSCIMPVYGVFARVITGGRVAPGDAIELIIARSS